MSVIQETKGASYASHHNSGTGGVGGTESRGSNDVMVLLRPLMAGSTNSVVVHDNSNLPSNDNNIHDSHELNSHYEAERDSDHMSSNIISPHESVIQSNNVTLDESTCRTLSGLPEVELVPFTSAASSSGVESVHLSHPLKAGILTASQPKTDILTQSMVTSNVLTAADLDQHNITIEGEKHHHNLSSSDLDDSLNHHQPVLDLSHQDSNSQQNIFTADGVVGINLTDMVSFELTAADNNPGFLSVISTSGEPPSSGATTSGAPSDFSGATSVHITATEGSPSVTRREFLRGRCTPSTPTHSPPSHQVHGTPHSTPTHSSMIVPHTAAHSIDSHSSSVTTSRATPTDSSVSYSVYSSPSPTHPSNNSVISSRSYSSPPRSPTIVHIERRVSQSSPSSSSYRGRKTSSSSPSPQLLEASPDSQGNKFF